MSNTILKLSITFTYFILSATSCSLFSHQDNAPGISIYKTNGDYYNLVDIGMKEDRIIRTDTYLQELFKFEISDGDTIYKYRARLVRRYIIDSETDENSDVFLNLTFKQHMSLEKKFPKGIPHDTLKHYIIDKDPYLEFYRDVANPRKFSCKLEDVDTSEINQIIKNGELEIFFTRFK